MFDFKNEMVMVMTRVFINPRVIEFITCVDMFNAIVYDAEDCIGGELERDDVLNQTAYSLKPADYDSRRFEFAGCFIEIKPSPQGLPIIRDFDILIYLTSWLQNAWLGNEPENLSLNLQFSATEFLKFTGRGDGGAQYQGLLQSLKRLSGSEITTNIPAPESSGWEEENRFNLIKYDAERNSDGSIGMINISIPRKLYRIFSSDRCDYHHGCAIHPDYFNLKPLHRIIYLIALTHCTSEDPLTLSLDKLHFMTGASSPLRKFRDAIKEIIAQPLIEFKLSADEDLRTIHFIRPSDYVHDSVEYITEIFGVDDEDEETE